MYVYRTRFENKADECNSVCAREGPRTDRCAQAPKGQAAVLGREHSATHMIL